MSNNQPQLNRTAAPTVLWWSRSGRDYSRDRVIRHAFQSLGWVINDFSPTFSRTADLEAVLRRVRVPDLVWVPCFRQRDTAAAQRWAKKNGVPIVFDPLISAWDKQVFERQKFAENSRSARQLLRWEAALFRNSDALIADTACHAEFFRQAHGVEAANTFVIPVGAEESLFPLQPISSHTDRLRVLFYGSYIGLQGPQFIAQAATQVTEVDWTFIGSGPLLEGCRHLAGNAHHVEFIPRVPYDKLAAKIGQADVLLGVFGDSEKAARVIPNKVYQALACGRTVVTRSSAAYPPELLDQPSRDSGITWVREGDAREIADAVRAFVRDRGEVSQRGLAARKTYDDWFSNQIVRDALSQVLQKFCPTIMSGIMEAA